MPLLHKGPLIVDHLFGVGPAEFLDVGAFRFRKPMDQPGDLRQGVGFLLDTVTLAASYSSHTAMTTSAIRTA